MRITIGAPPTGDDFFRRDATVRALIRALETEHVLFLAPRRTGKTSVLLHLRDNAPAPTVYLDLEGFDHPKYWIEAMCRELRKINDPRWLSALKNAGDFLRQFESRFLKIRESEWQQKANDFLDALAELKQPIWFLLDEFPWMVDHIARKHGKEEATTTLHWIRRTRQQNTSNPVRFLLTGSIGLDSVLRRHGIRGAANDLRREWLQPITEAEAIDLAVQLANDNKINLNRAWAEQYVERLGPGCWPYFIQLFMAQLQDEDALPFNLEQIYEAVVFSKRNQYADNMWQRLAEIFSDAEAHAARTMLAIVAETSDGLSSVELRARVTALAEKDYEYVLDVLQHDGYLAESMHPNVTFFSNLLRDYWRRKGRV